MTSFCTLPLPNQSLKMQGYEFIKLDSDQLCLYISDSARCWYVNVIFQKHTCSTAILEDCMHWVNKLCHVQNSALKLHGFQRVHWHGVFIGDSRSTLWTLYSTVHFISPFKYSTDVHPECAGLLIGVWRASEYKRTLSLTPAAKRFRQPQPAFCGTCLTARYNTCFVQKKKRLLKKRGFSKAHYCHDAIKARGLIVYL